MKTFLVTYVWRSALNIGAMRVFDNFADAKAYWFTVDSMVEFRRMYEVSTDCPPVLIRAKSVEARQE